MENEINFYKRQLPHWTLKGATYFVTFCVKNNIKLSKIELTIVKNHILEGNDKFY